MNARKIMTLFIWWTSQQDCEALSHEIIGYIGTKKMPEYMMHEFRSRYGRAGRGRLWVDRKFRGAAVYPWPQTPLADVLGEYYGGIVFDEADLSVLREAPGIITDMRLKRLGE